MKPLHKFLFSICISLFSFTACNNKQEAVPISFGTDQCGFCKMTISNPKFGAELITDKGRVIKYDAAECMVNHLNSDAPKYKKLFVVPYDLPKELIDVDSCQYIISPDFRSPMGANLAAFYDIQNLDENYQSQLIDWQALLKTIQ